MTFRRTLAIGGTTVGLLAIASIAWIASGRPANPVNPAPTGFATPPPASARHASPAPPTLPSALALKQRYTLNQSAFIPPQCYTKTTDDRGRVHNPCYTCHVASRGPNFINDADVQLEYAFVPRARTNPWKNLFIDWTERIAAVSDSAILDYVRESNYFDAAGNIVLAAKLSAPPPAWDQGDDGVWSGYVPDTRFSFDEHGFDRTASGGYSGWRAFAYYPVPGTFWPTNGSMGDVMIRLPKAFRERVAGSFDRTTYELNLAIVESLITRRDVGIAAVEETEFGVDLDGDGKLGTATGIHFDESPESESPGSYVGLARTQLQAGDVHLAPGLYPEGTEFLHSVRYLDPTDAGIQLAARMKELRYAVKTEWFTQALLDKRAKVEAVTKTDSPSELRNFGGDIERGISNNQGWYFQGFIEDEVGQLRPQSFEENAYCTGCHGGVGVNDDGIFSFSRRLDRSAFREGWYHWSQRGLEGVPDRSVHGGATEYVTYLEQNGAGDEFRQNDEVARRFFDEEGALRPEMRTRLEKDVSILLLPSKERALALNKAYSLLAKTQSFRFGRELVLNGAREVHRSVEDGQKTGITTPVEPPWSERFFALEAATP